MDRRAFISAIVLAVPVAAEAQQAGKVPRVGFLGPAAASANEASLEAFRSAVATILKGTEQPRKFELISSLKTVKAIISPPEALILSQRKWVADVQSVFEATVTSAVRLAGSRHEDPTAQCWPVVMRGDA